MIPLVRDNLDRIRDLCREHGVRRLFLIGSATSAAFDAARSDLDFLVEFEPRPRGGFDDVFFKLQAGLEDLLGRRVDLIEAETVRNPYLRASIERSKQLLHAA